MLWEKPAKQADMSNKLLRAEKVKEDLEVMLTTSAVAKVKSSNSCAGTGAVGSASWDLQQPAVVRDINKENWKVWATEP